MKTLKFNEQMIAAIKSGRKTQTRRVMNPQPQPGYSYDGIDIWSSVFSNDEALLQVHFPFQRYNHIDNETVIRITEFRAEHLGDISKEDCMKEGIGCLSKDGETYKYGITDKDGLPGNDDFGWHWNQWELEPKAAFKKLWNSIYPTGEKAWRDNLWVWVIDFEVVK